MHLHLLFIGLLYFLVENYGENHEHHKPEFENYTDHDPNNGSIEWAQDERLVPDPTYANLMEAVVQLWWSQRGIVNNIRHEKDELRRLKAVHVDKFDDLIDELDATIEKHISSLSLWDEPERENLNPMNKTAIDDLMKKWKFVDEFFGQYEVDGAEEITSRILLEMKTAQDDLLRRWVTIDRLLIEIEEQREQKNEDEKYRQNKIPPSS